MKYIKYIFILFTIIAVTYVAAGQIFLPPDNIENRNVVEKYTGDWVYVNEDGTRTPIELPGKISNDYTIETVIPSNLSNEINGLCLRCQDMNAYLDEELIFSYSAKKNRWFGTISPECYLTIPISSEDEGKVLRITAISDSGIMYQPYIGSSIGIWLSILKIYAGELVIASITLIMGLLVVIISNVFGIMKKKYLEISFLGIGVILAAIWIIINSVFRQIVFPNLSVADDALFITVMLLPFPFLIYMDNIQKKRYTWLYCTAGTVMTVIDIVCSALYIAGIRELTFSFIYIAIGCLLAISSVGITIILDLVKGNIKNYRFVAIGILGATISAFAQIIIYFNRDGFFSGSIFAFGLLFLLCIAAVQTFKNLFSIERDKTAAELASESKGKFLARMSHEIRTPINAILGMDEMILRECKDESIKEYAFDIQNAGKSLLSLINEILDMSKIESGKMEIIPAAYDLSSMIHDIINMISIKAKDKSLEIITEIDDKLPSWLIGDDIRIRQVLINLLNNAVKYTEKGSVTLAVSGTATDEEAILHFEVRDTGIGIKEEDIPKLFEQFTRLEEERNRYIEGTGLGMSIIIQLLELMGSRIQVSSTYGEGSCFYFDLKQGVKDHTPIGDISYRIQKQEDLYQNRECLTACGVEILVVDDNSINRKVVKNLLKETGIIIDEAESGKQCLQKVRNKKYDIILLDHMMPGLDGIETLHEMKNLECNMSKDAPVIALTANAVKGAREMYLREGFDDFLSKPISYLSLEKMIKRHLTDDKITDETEDYSTMGIGDLLEKIPEINLHYAYIHNNSPEELFDGILKFINQIDEEAGLLEGYADKADDMEALKQYRIKIHTMKTSAALIGAMRLSEKARILENAAINCETDVVKRDTKQFLNDWKSYKEVLSPVSKRAEINNSI